MKLSLALGFNQMEVGGVHGARLSFPLPFLFGFSIMERNGEVALMWRKRT